MRRRDRFANTVWLARFLSQPEESQEAHTGLDTDHVGALAEAITKRFLYGAELRYIDSAYEVDLYPQVRTETFGQYHPAFSYRGPNLRSILSAALLELSMIRDGRNPFEVTTRRRPRWVR